MPDASPLERHQASLINSNPPLKPIARTCEDGSNSACMERIDNALYCGIGADSEEEYTDENDEDVERTERNPRGCPWLVGILATVGTAHAEVSDAPEYEAEEAIKQR